MKIEITFLGTSQAIPTASRNHTAILLTYKDENILVDCGEGTQRQFRKARINPCKLTKLLITHWHGDHVLGIPGLLQTLAMNNYQKTLNIYGPKGTKKFIEEIKRIFIPVKEIKYTVTEINTGKFFENKDFELHTLPLEHGAPCNGYFFKELDKLRIDKEKLKKLKLPNIPEIGKLLEKKDITFNKKKIQYKDLTYLEKGQKISFIFDTKLCHNANTLAKDSNLAIIESTYSKDEENLAKEYLHMTCVEAAKIAKKENVKQLALVHLSQRYEHKEKMILSQAKEIFKNTIIPDDLQRLEVENNS